RRPEARAPDPRIPHLSLLRPGPEGSPRQSASAAAGGRPISSDLHPRPCCPPEGRVMICQRCGAACANRTEGRRVRLAGEELFVCNVCSLHAVAGGGGGEPEATRGVSGAAPRRGNWL